MSWRPERFTFLGVQWEEEHSRPGNIVAQAGGGRRPELGGQDPQKGPVAFTEETGPSLGALLLDAVHLVSHEVLVQRMADWRWPEAQDY